MVISEFIGREAFNLICGKKIAGGEFRDVYNCSIDPSLVVKVEDRSKSFCNAFEMKIWNEFKDVKSVARWLAPCVDISPCGAIMLQKKVERVHISNMPKTMPEFLRDFKIENFGMFEGRLVCCDYGGLTMDLPTKRKKVEWWTHPIGDEPS